MRRAELFGVIAGAFGLAVGGFQLGAYFERDKIDEDAVRVGTLTKEVLGANSFNVVVERLKQNDSTGAQKLIEDEFRGGVSSTSCVPAGEKVTMNAGDFIDQCDSSAEIYFQGYRNVGIPARAYFTINGRTVYTDGGGKIALSDDCSLTYLAAVRNENSNKPHAVVVRPSCN